MSKNLINSAGDFLHLYLGCPVLVTPYEGASYECKLCGVSVEKIGGETEIKVQVFEDDGPDGYEGHGHKWFDADEVELVLRKTSTMTDSEKEETSKLYFDFMETQTPGTRNIYMMSHMTKWYLERGFDLYGLIEAGFAIDSTERVGVN